MITNRIINGNNIDTLKTLPDCSVNCCVTSPPYYGLRDYGTAQWEGGDPACNHFNDKKPTDNTFSSDKIPKGDAIYKTVCKKCGAIRIDNQIGLEETPQEYIKKLVDVFCEVRRILKDDGTLWVVIGDSYAGSGKGAANYPENAKKYKQGTSGGMLGAAATTKVKTSNCKNKDLIGVPWMLAFALRAEGWYLRQDIIWSKQNPMPESVKDRCTKSHEYIFMLSKSKRYYFDNKAIKEKAVKKTEKIRDRDSSKLNRTPGRRRMQGLKLDNYITKNKRDVWNIPTKPYKEAHFAVFPEELITPCILAGSREGGIILDPFMGSGTVAVVAVKSKRKYLGCELNGEYIKMAEKRIKETEIMTKEI